jgi:hypothetical protein
MQAQLKDAASLRESPQLYYWIIGSLCLIYLVIQLGFISYEKLTVDDLWLSYHTYQFKSLLPYRDFAPYKTTLGYYVLLMPMSIFHGVIMPLLCTKAFIAFINATLLSFTAVWMKRFFSGQAIILSALILIFSQFFLNYSAEIRVDILAYWLCLISILLIFEKKLTLAGIVSGLSFAISQKALWYVLATNFALGGFWIYHACSLKMLRQIISYNLATLAIIILYIAFWAFFSDLHTVLHNVFYEAYLVFAIDSYDYGRLVLWQSILWDNSLYFLLLPLPLLSLFIIPEPDRHRGLRIFIILLAAIILFSIISYKQPFPYNMPATFPAFFVLYAAMFSWLHAIFSSRSYQIVSIGKAGILSLLVIYLIGLICLIRYFLLPIYPFMILLIPLALGAYILYPIGRKELFTVIIVTTCITGILFPTIGFIRLLPELNGKYQKYTLNLSDAILANGGDYVAGVPLFYNKNLAIPGLKHIVLPSLVYLYHPSEKLLPVMNLPSLYLTPSTSEQIVESLKNSAVKLYINNERLEGVPPLIKNYLATQYQHFWGSIYLYAPTVNAGKQIIKIKFAGTYKINSKKPISLQGRKLRPGTVVVLSAQDYASKASQSYRLVLIPAINLSLLKPEYQQDTWEKTLE